MIQVFPNNDEVFKIKLPPVTKMELFIDGLNSDYELQHFPYRAQSPDFIITEPFWSGLETVKHRVPPPKYLKQLEDILQGEWYKILLETVQNLYESIP
jgi:hypothetical protein